jgi:hypothetical protein
MEQHKHESANIFWMCCFHVKSVYVSPFRQRSEEGGGRRGCRWARLQAVPPGQQGELQGCRRLHPQAPHATASGADPLACCPERAEALSRPELVTKLDQDLERKPGEAVLRSCRAVGRGVHCRLSATKCGHHTTKKRACETSTKTGCVTKSPSAKYTRSGQWAALTLNACGWQAGPFPSSCGLWRIACRGHFPAWNTGHYQP